MSGSCDKSREAGEQALARARHIIDRKVPSLRLSQRDNGFVYFIRAGEQGPIKIGTALDVPRRLKKLQQAHSEKLTILAARKGGRVTERKYHERFAALRIRGEWFEPSEAILTEVARLSR